VSLQADTRPLIAGWKCLVCSTEVDISQALAWRCPNATDDDRHHALALVQSIAPLRSGGDINPFLAYRHYLAVDAFASAHGMTDAARMVLIAQTDASIAAVAGVGFHETPFLRADALSDELGFTADGGVWVKDETGQVAGSHKARHLMSILLHLRVAETVDAAGWSTPAGRPPLAIASCGNAAFAAATLAAAVAWPIQVFVPPSAHPVVLARLAELGADVVECPRLDDDPPGDPCIHRFRSAVAHGAIPFTVQGTENVWCLDGGRTVGWEMARVMETSIDGPPFDRVFVQVGAGTFAGSVMAGFRMNGITPRLHAVQTASCAPLRRAWEVAQRVGVRRAAAHWSECMWPWEHVGASAADGILDDETYDWLPLIGALADSNGSAVVVDEAQVVAANELATRTTSIAASHTGTAGLAGLLAMGREVARDDRIAVIFSGILR
jgi:threonine synthase